MICSALAVLIVCKGTHSSHTSECCSRVSEVCTHFTISATASKGWFVWLRCLNGHVCIRMLPHLCICGGTRIVHENGAIGWGTRRFKGSDALLDSVVAGLALNYQYSVLVIPTSNHAKTSATFWSEVAVETVVHQQSHQNQKLLKMQDLTIRSYMYYAILTQ